MENYTIVDAAAAVALLGNNSKRGGIEILRDSLYYSTETQEDRKGEAEGGKRRRGNGEA